MVGKEGVALPDGRLERSARTRKALIEAYLDLAREKKRIPTTTEVAQRAGCSQRLIFERFGSLGQLGLAAFDHILLSRERTVPDGEVLNAGRQARIRYQVGVRALRCETWLPVWRLVSSVQGAPRALEERIERVRSLTRARLELMYQPELGTLAEPARRSILIALEALTDWACWGRMREHYGLSFEQASQVWIETVDRLLPPTPAA
jgi:AcrR family transcriptional regulator